MCLGGDAGRAWAYSGLTVIGVKMLMLLKKWEFCFDELMKIFTRMFGAAILLFGATFGLGCGYVGAKSEGACVDLQIVFVRGSGAVRYESGEWQALVEEASAEFGRKTWDYAIEDLDYDANGTDGFWELLGAYVSAGKAAKFGDSVAGGIRALGSFRSQTKKSCPNTKWALVGYSQGAKVIADSMEMWHSDEVIYVGLLGDPGLFLPEGEGWSPPACRGENLSNYRVFAPDCRTNSGIFGQRNPYEAVGFEGKYGLWCNDDDLICGSSKNLLVNDGHLNYVGAGAFAKLVDYIGMMMDKNSTVDDGSADDEDWSDLDLDLSRWERTSVLNALLFANKDLGLVLIWMPGRNDAEFYRLLTKYNHELDLMGVERSAKLQKTTEGDARAYSMRHSNDVSVRLAVEKVEPEPVLPTLKSLAASWGDNTLRIDWVLSGEADYVVLVVNGVILGYAEADLGGIWLEDLAELKEEELLVRVAAMDESFNFGDWAELSLENRAYLVRVGAENGIDVGVETEEGIGGEAGGRDGEAGDESDFLGVMNWMNGLSSDSGGGHGPEVAAVPGFSDTESGNGQDENRIGEVAGTKSADWDDGVWVAVVVSVGVVVTAAISATMFYRHWRRARGP